MATTGLYQAVTILALLIGAALILFIGIVYTQNQQTWAILNPSSKSLQGPVSSLRFAYPSGTGGNAFQVQDSSTGKELFSSSILTTNAGSGLADYNAITSPGGRFLVTMRTPPVVYPVQPHAS